LVPSRIIEIEPGPALRNCPLEEAMRKFLLISTAAVAVTMAAMTESDAISINAGAGIKPVIDAIDMMQKAQVFIVDGRRYCFYFDGWHGEGWYRCGYARRDGFGWGGEYGWQGWNYAPYERRHGGERKGKVEEQRRAAPTGGGNIQPSTGGKVEEQRRAAPTGGGNVQPSTSGGNKGGGGDKGGGDDKGGGGDKGGSAGGSEKK
jgi:uncharacterized membrane protein YgcG